MVQVGQKAPDFKLIDKDKNTVTLDKYKGKNLIIFFILLMTAVLSGCSSSQTGS